MAGPFATLPGVRQRYGLAADPLRRCISGARLNGASVIRAAVVVVLTAAAVAGCSKDSVGGEHQPSHSASASASPSWKVAADLRKCDGITTAEVERVLGGPANFASREPNICGYDGLDAAAGKSFNIVHLPADADLDATDLASARALQTSSQRVVTHLDLGVGAVMVESANVFTGLGFTASGGRCQVMLQDLPGQFAPWITSPADLAVASALVEKGLRLCMSAS